MHDTSDRFSRQSELVPRDVAASQDATVLGVGAIGRQVALQLAALGVGKLRLVDFDVVEFTNVTTQGYRAHDVGMPKVEAMAAAIREIDPAIALEIVQDRFRPSISIGDSLFCCVDSISSRAAIWRAVGQRCAFWCDGRMLGEVMRILATTSTSGSHQYGETLFPQDEAQSGSCTARGTLYTAAIAAGLMVHQFTRWLRKLPVTPDLALNLLASELSAS